MKKYKGFSLLEMMVGMLIIMIALMGFTSMVTMQAMGNKIAKGSDEASTLVQSKVESLSNVQFSVLGTDAGCSDTGTGMTSANVCTIGPMDRLGATNGSNALIYYRSFVICSSTDSTPAGASPNYCGTAMSGSNRPSILSCSGLGLTAKEKMIRVLVSWSDKYGKCHHVATDSLSYNWSGS